MRTATAHASPPPLVYRTISALGIFSHSNSARSISRALFSVNRLPLSICAFTAPSTASSAWPRMIAMTAFTQSMYSLPSTSQNRAPFARSAYMGETGYAYPLARLLMSCVLPGINSSAFVYRSTDFWTLLFFVCVIGNLGDSGIVVLGR